MPEEVIQEVRQGSTLVRPRSMAGGGGSRGFATAEVSGTDLRLGQRVFHEKFGEGVILTYEGEGSSARVQVNFNDAGSKWLVMGYANLKPVG